MGAVVSVVIPAVVAGVVGLIRALRSSDVAPNPTMQDVEEAAAEVERQRLAAAAALQKAQDDADEAKRQVDEAKKKAEEAKQRADEAQRRSDDEKRKAEDAKRKIDQEKKEMEDAKNKAEEEKRHAEAEKKKADEERRNAQEAKDKADREKQNAEEARAQADDDRKKAEDARAQAEEDMRKAEDDAKETRRQAEESRLAAEAERKVVEEQKREAEEAFLRAEEERRLAEEEADRARAEQLEADERASEAQRQADVAKAAQQKALENLQVQTARADEAETKWMRGDRPVVWPTLEEIESAKIRFDYTEGKFHFAIAGLAGSGKSSLINAFRGLTNNDPRAANTGIVETTLYVTGYPDPDPKNPFIWYDIPGAGTLEIPDWQYFNAQGLFVFDCIIVLIDNRFSATDIAILENCKRFNIPSYIVRSKANQHVLNIMNDMGYDFMTDDGTQRAQLLPAARARFIAETRQSVKANLEKAELPPKRVYIVSKDAVVTVIQGKAMRKDTLMDEVELVEDILKEATRRRMKPKQKA